VAKSWGARQILFVAKHTGGFCWWQTETSRYGIKETPWKGGKGDVLRELSEACRRHGLKLAIYVYPGDDQWGAGIGSGGRTRDPARQAAYNEVFRQQLTEVLTRYGEMSEVWFDGSCVIEVGDLLQRHAPRAMVLQGPHTTLRWVGNEQGYAPYPAWQTVRRKDAETGVSTAAHSDPDGDVWLPLECDTTLIDHKWFWGPHTDHRLKSLDKLMDIYEKSAGRGCVLLLNSTPDTSGLIPQSHVQLYESFGQEIERRYGRPLAETNGLVLDFGRPLAVNAALLEEDIREGQRVRAYRWEGLAGGAWVPLHTNGLSVGRKQIDRFPRVEVSQLRFVATRSVGEPIIRRLAAFNVQRTVRGEPLQDVLYPFDEQAGAGRRGKDFEGAKASLGNLQIGDSDFTIAAAIFPRSCRTGQDRIVAKERIGVSANQFRLYLHEGNRLGFAMTDGASQGTAYPFVTAPDSVPTGRWTQVALTRRGADITLHLNGREAARTRTTGVIEHVNDLDLLVGAAYAAQGTRGDYAFDGDMARLRLYARALSPAELADPERLPDPGWTMALRWATNSFPAGGAADLDISAGLPRPGQYEVQFRPDAAGWSAERVDLVIGGQVLPGRVRRLEGRPLAFGLQRIEQTTAETPTILRVQARGDGAGSIWVRMQ
jgi:hypothetical protein